MLIDDKIRQVCDVIGPDLSQLQRQALRVALAEYAVAAVHDDQVLLESVQIISKTKENQ
jgi:hypothetical protein